jgi:hypothetical protein
VCTTFLLYRPENVAQVSDILRPLFDLIFFSSLVAAADGTYNYLNSESKKGGWSQEEDMLLCEVRF